MRLGWEGEFNINSYWAEVFETIWKGVVGVITPRGFTDFCHCGCKRREKPCSVFDGKYIDFIRNILQKKKKKIPKRNTFLPLGTDHYFSGGG